MNNPDTIMAIALGVVMIFGVIFVIIDRILDYKRDIAEIDLKKHSKVDAWSATGPSPVWPDMFHTEERTTYYKDPETASKEEKKDE